MPINLQEELNSLEIPVQGGKTQGKLFLITYNYDIRRIRGYSTKFTNKSYGKFSLDVRQTLEGLIQRHALEHEIYWAPRS